MLRNFPQKYFCTMIKKKQNSLVAQMAKNPPAVQETWAQFLGLENPLEK